MSIFEHIDYMKFLKEKLKSSLPRRGQKKVAAEAARCQPSYFSLVLKGQAHLTIEQAEGLCRYWRMSADETDFFVLLVSHARAGTSELKTYFKKKLKNLKEARENLSQRIQNAEVMPEIDAAIYYSNWLYLAVHIAISISSFQTERALADRLQVSAEAVNQVLNFLQRLGLAEQKDGAWRSTQKEFHLPKDSAFVSLHHGNWRRRAVDNALLRVPDDLHYTGVSSIAKRDIDVLRTKILALIDESRKIIGPSPEEELICFSVDLFVI